MSFKLNYTPKKRVKLLSQSDLCVFYIQGDPLWSARLLHTNPQAIRDAHYRYVHAKLSKIQIIYQHFKDPL